MTAPSIEVPTGWHWNGYTFRRECVTHNGSCVGSVVGCSDGTYRWSAVRYRTGGYKRGGGAASSWAAAFAEADAVMA